MENTHRSRLSVDITSEQREGLDRHLSDYGMKKMVFHLLIDKLIQLCDSHGAGVVIGALVEKAIGIRELAGLKIKDGNNK